MFCNRIDVNLSTSSEADGPDAESGSSFDFSAGFVCCGSMDTDADV